MAESTVPSSLTERYTALEQAYCADQWGAVINQGRNLLDEIPRTPGLLPEGLRERVQLLMAHALLYGFSDRDRAEDLYREVLHSKAEVALRRIAEQGLQQCSGPVQVQTAVYEPEPPTPQQVDQSPAVATAAPAAAAAARSDFSELVSANTSSLAKPWLEPGSAPTPWAATAIPAPEPLEPIGSLEGDEPQDAILIPEVLEEPELLQVHQADPTLAEELDLTELGSNQAQPQPVKELSLTKPDSAPEQAYELFRHPPAPVEEEDQELLLGLLRVLVQADSAHGGG